jgi:hypothetical protein
MAGRAVEHRIREVLLVVERDLEPVRLDRRSQQVARRAAEHAVVARLPVANDVEAQLAVDAIAHHDLAQLLAACEREREQLGRRALQPQRDYTRVDRRDRAGGERSRVPGDREAGQASDVRAVDPERAL